MKLSNDFIVEDRRDMATLVTLVKITSEKLLEAADRDDVSDQELIDYTDSLALMSEQIVKIWMPYANLNHKDTMDAGRKLLLDILSKQREIRA